MTGPVAGNPFLAQEEFGRAVRELAVGLGSIKKRLEEAAYHIIQVDETDVPDHLQSDFNWIIESLTSAPVEAERIPATLATMDDEKAQDIAQAIVSLDYRLNGSKPLG